LSGKSQSQKATPQGVAFCISLLHFFTRFFSPASFHPFILSTGSFEPPEALPFNAAFFQLAEALLMRSPAPVARAAIWMVGWLAMMLVLPVAGREAARELTLVQVMELRSVLGFLMMYPLIHRSGGLAAVRSQRPWLHVWRNGVHFAAQYGWLLAITLIPLAQVIAIEFTMPIWTALLAASLLGERMTRWKNAAIVLGLVGVLVIVRPGASSVSFGQMVALATAVGFAGSIIMIKSLTRTDSALTILFWMVIVQAAIGLIPALFVWVWPSPVTWAWLAMIAFCGTFSHYCMARALHYADATVVVPMDFLRVPLSAALGWLVYSETVDIYTAAGAALILVGNLLNLKGSAAAKRKG
jgi:drug/metabolite transporter (DMT)-like permease